MWDNRGYHPHLEGNGDLSTLGFIVFGVIAICVICYIIKKSKDFDDYDY